jgi:hypothetical protein
VFPDDSDIRKSSYEFLSETKRLGLEFADSAGVMQLINEQFQDSELALAAWQNRKDGALRRETAQFLSRLDFRHISNHLSQRRPGYYLILLRNEIRHRSLREKPTVTD